MSHQNLINHPKLSGILRTPRIISAFEKIDRADFVKEEFKNEAYADYPLSIGFNQTISQPTTVAFMIELLSPKTGDKILDVGSGSGWTAALLAHIVSSTAPKLKAAPAGRQVKSEKLKVTQQKGQVIAIEKIPELAKFGETNIAKYNYIESGIVKVLCADGSKGLPKEAPFDKILASASALNLPKELVEQLKNGGTLVIPISTSIFKITKDKQGKISTEEYPGFVFVPLITENS